MSRLSLNDHEAFGSAILERLSELKVPAFLKPTVHSFSDVHRALIKASIAVADVRAERDDRLAGIGVADDALDEAVMNLADTLVGQKLGSRKNPFEGYVKHAPSRICSLGYAREVAEVRKLIKAVGKKKSAPKKELAALAILANEVDAALESYQVAQSRLGKAIGKRDALLLDWQKSLGRLKKLAAAAWVDDEPTYRAIFAMESSDPLTHAEKRKPAGRGRGKGRAKGEKAVAKRRAKKAAAAPIQQEEE